MSAKNEFGRVYRCPVCGAEVTVVGGGSGRFAPVCCNRPMMPKHARAIFYFCPVCGSELVVVREGAGAFKPRCCNVDMVCKAA